MDASSSLRISGSRNSPFLKWLGVYVMQRMNLNAIDLRGCHIGSRAKFQEIVCKGTRPSVETMEKADVFSICRASLLVRMPMQADLFLFKRGCTLSERQKQPQTYTYMASAATHEQTDLFVPFTVWMRTKSIQ